MFGSHAVVDHATHLRAPSCENLFEVTSTISSCSMPQPKASVATEMLESLPERALNLIRSSGFQGADLIKLESDIHRPSFRDKG